MGGLAGLVHHDGSTPSRDVLRAMSTRLAHRGPDGHGEFFEGPAAFAHRRRAVVPDNVTQPVVADDFVVMMDGIIYDHREVAQHAGEADRVTDTQALLAAWRRWGPDLVKFIDGAFAAAIWDRREQTLHLVRDRLGIRPMFWARTGRQFAFASELPALLRVPWVSRELALENLAEYLSFRVVHPPRTLLRDIHQLEPAHWLRCSADGVANRRYWMLHYAPPGTPRPREGEVIPALQQAMDRAVKRRLDDGATTALYFSGGIGSTAIAAAARHLNRPLPTFTIAFDDDPHPETPFAGRIASLLGMEHHEVRIGSADLADSFDPLVAALGEPVGNPAALYQLHLARAARVRARVVLTGDGAEELFGGRSLDDLAQAIRLARMVAGMPGVARKALVTGLRAMGRGRRIERPLARYGLDHGFGGVDLFGTDERAALLADPTLAGPDVRRDVLTPFYDGLDTDPFNAVLAAFLASRLSTEGLTRSDRTAATMGLDVRYPLLDREVVTMAAALPGRFKYRRSSGSVHTRWPLRALLEGALPTPLINRPKRGMPSPVTWLGHEGRLFLEDRTRRLVANPRGLWRPDAILELKAKVQHPSSALRLWSLFMLQGWLNWLDAE
jgi:asparagine synthase (glutamine-hydrolysing)